jgi:hypothetical protein
MGNGFDIWIYTNGTLYAPGMVELSTNGYVIVRPHIHTLSPSLFYAVFAVILWAWVVKRWAWGELKFRDGAVASGREVKTSNETKQ